MSLRGNKLGRYQRNRIRPQDGCGRARRAVERNNVRRCPIIRQVRLSIQPNRCAWRLMHLLLRAVVALSVAVTACQSRVEEAKPDTASAQQTVDSPAPPSRGRVSGPADSPTTARHADSITAAAVGREPGSIPARPTPTTTSENTIAKMRLHLQRLDTASVENLQRSMKEHASMLGDMLTTMEVEVQAVTSPAKNSWLAASRQRGE